MVTCVLKSFSPNQSVWKSAPQLFRQKQTLSMNFEYLENYPSFESLKFCAHFKNLSMCHMEDWTPRLPWGFALTHKRQNATKRPPNLQQSWEGPNFNFQLERSQFLCSPLEGKPCGEVMTVVPHMSLKLSNFKFILANSETSRGAWCPESITRTCERATDRWRTELYMA